MPLLNVLADLYHERWSIEELTKTLKHTTTLEHVHGKSERGVRQKLYAHFNLVAMTRLFTNQGDLSPPSIHYRYHPTHPDKRHQRPRRHSTKPQRGYSYTGPHTRHHPQPAHWPFFYYTSSFFCALKSP